MRGRDFLDKMELVSPIYVEGADRTPIIRPKQWPKFVIAAACLCLMAWGAWSFTGGFGREPGYVLSPGESQGPERAQIEVDGMTLEACPGTLGFDECWVRRSGEPDAAIWLYYTRRENGQYRLAAQSWWNAKSAAPYEIDLDGDGVKELIFNLNYEDGLREIQIIRHGDGEIQYWYFNNEFLRDHWEEQGLTVLDGATEHIRSYYDPARGIVLEADCYDETGKEVLSVEVFHDLEHFKYFIDERHTYADEIEEPKTTVELGKLIIEGCPPTLGFDECWVARRKDVPGTHVGYFCARVDNGTIQCIAETCTLFDELDVYRVDLDGDGVEELICNNTFGDGVETAYIYRNCGDGIEVGWLAWGYWDLYGFNTMGAASARSVRYDPERGFVAAGLDLEGEPKEEIVQDMGHFRFEPYDAPEIDWSGYVLYGDDAANFPIDDVVNFPMGVGCDELLHDDVASIAPEPCPATLGFENCVMTLDESQGFPIWGFYAWENGQYRLIAEVWGGIDEDMPEVYRVDMDGNGVDELIWNRVYADGRRDVVVYRNRNGQIEQGWPDMDYILEEWSERGFYPVGFDSIARWYNPNLNSGTIVVEALCRNEKQEEIQIGESLVDLEHIVFNPYNPATIPLGVTTIADN